jgi:hypothetical protein
MLIVEPGCRIPECYGTIYVTIGLIRVPVVWNKRGLCKYYTLREVSVTTCSSLLNLE